PIEEHSRSLHEALFALFILEDGSVDLLRIRRRVLERSLQVGGSQSRCGVKDYFVGHSQLARPYKSPNCDASVSDARIAAATIGLFRYPGRGCCHCMSFLPACLLAKFSSSSPPPRSVRPL